MTTGRDYASRRPCSRVNLAGFLACILATCIWSTVADAAGLSASINLFTPEEDDIENDLRLNDVEDPDARALLRETEVPSTILREELSFDADALPMELGGDIINAEVDFLIGEWVASGVADAQFDRLAVAAFFAGFRDADDFGLGGTVDSTAGAGDVLTVGGTGEGQLTFIFSVSGRVDVTVQPAVGTDVRNPIRSASYNISFFAELDVRGGARDRENVDRDHSTSAEGNTAFEIISEEISITVPVQSGDVVDYETNANALIDFSRFPAAAQRRGFSNFGSTATLTSVALSNDSLSLSSESGFDYLAASGAPDTGGPGGSSPGTNEPSEQAEPIPTMGIYLLTALAILLAILGWRCRAGIFSKAGVPR
ncbi:MAG: hypothetical protein ABR578_03380 [Chromatocurvus sp.]